jgi:xylan 1,4-beta-xylosidase
MSERVQDTVRRASGLPVFYTEWNTSSNPFFHRHDEPYAAAFVAKTCLDVANDVEGYSYWTFSDIFEENYFSSVPFHGGFGLLTIHGVAKPTYRAFQLMHALGDERLLVDGIHPTIDCYATRGEGKLVVLLTNHALPEHAISAASVRLRLAGAAGFSAGVVQRIDAEHANPRREWERMGEPEYPSAEQLERLHAASEVGRESLQPERDGEDLVLELELPAHAVASITFPGNA